MFSFCRLDLQTLSQTALVHSGKAGERLEKGSALGVGIGSCSLPVQAQVVGPLKSCELENLPRELKRFNPKISKDSLDIRAAHAVNKVGSFVFKRTIEEQHVHSINHTVE